MLKQFIFIMTDTQRKDMVGAYGNKEMLTPCLDQLAEDGMLFEKAYTAQPVCGPARSALFTGLYPHSNGVWSNSVGMDQTVKTIGKRLKDQGIKCGYIGKWHLDGGDYFGNGVCPEGWDERYWYDMRNYLEELTEEERVRSRNPRTICEGEGYDETMTFAHRCSERARAFIEEHKNEDFFLVVSYDEPHGPYICPKSYVAPFENHILEKKENFEDDLKNKPVHQSIWAEACNKSNKTNLKGGKKLFFGANHFVDYEIGRVLESYRANTPDALICYTSDHGDLLHSHQLMSKGPVMYEEITNIPFIMSARWMENKKSLYNGLISHIDVVPTILDFYGIEKYKMLQGKSLLGLTTDNTLKINNEIYMEFGRYEVDHDGFGGFQPIRCIVDDRYKLVINLLTTDELYDLHMDSGEMTNLIDSKEHVGIRNQLHDKLLTWMNETRDPFRGYYWLNRPWRVDAMPPTWKYTGETRQKEEDYDERRQLDYATGLPMVEATRRK